MNPQDSERPLATRAAITLDDVAALAQVSAATVSRALNRPALVKPAVRQRVELAVAQLGYVPNGAARALASKRTRTLGVVVPALDNTLFTDTVDAFQRRLDELDYVMVLTSAEHGSARELGRARTLVERGIDGLMLFGFRHDSALYGFLRERDVPFVNTWAAQADSPYPAIGFDSRVGAEMVIDYLLGLGHRSFGVIIGDPGRSDRTEARMIGTRNALARAGLALTAEQIVYSRYSVDAGRHACTELFARGQRPTAIIGGNDVLAVGILLECQQRGIRVPADLSVIGFGDASIAAHVIPALSTVRTPTAAMGRHAADYLVARAEGREALLPPSLELMLIPRGSTGPIAQPASDGVSSGPKARTRRAGA